MAHLPEEFRPLVRTALREYTEGGNAVSDRERSKKYSEYMLEQIAMGRERFEYRTQRKEHHTAGTEG